MEQESFKSKETAKKKVTRKANPEETLARGPESGVESDQKLAAKGRYSQASEALTHGYRDLKADMDPFDNERNYKRMCPDEHGVAQDPMPNERAYDHYLPAPKNGPKEKRLDQDSEDYGENATSDSSDLDD